MSVRCSGAEIWLIHVVQVVSMVFWVVARVFWVVAKVFFRKLLGCSGRLLGGCSRWFLWSC